MAISAGPPSGTIQRGRGGFMRNEQGTPYITDPSGALVKSGDRKGEPKRLPYGSPSGAGKQIENTFNLTKWGERRVVMGIGVDLALIADCNAVAQLDPESDEFKEAADRIVMRAKEAAQAGLAADRGTHGHALTEDHDEERDWIARAEAGEILGLDVEVQRSLVKAWQECIERHGLEILAVEASCVDDTWRLAGTLDRIARCTKSLRFALATGEVVVIPSGTVLVLDVKSGKRRTRPKDGSILYWQAYAIQIASYAQSVPYDLDTETRGEWPWPISQEHALIAHLDVLGAIEGNPSCELVYVDLTAGREHGGATWLGAKEWEKRRDVFSIAHLVDHDVTTASDLADESQPSAPSSPPAPPAPGGAERQVETAEGSSSAPAVDEQNVTAGAGDREVPDGRDAVATAAVTPSSAEELTPSGSSALTPRDERQALTARGAPDEGPAVAAADIDALQAVYATLDQPRNAWIRELVRDAQQAGVPFHLKGHPTHRRHRIVAGLIALADNGAADDETLRSVLAVIVGDIAHFPTVSPGHVLGTLGADEATTFAQLCAELVDGVIPGDVDETTGRVVLRFPSLAAPAA